MAELSKTYEPAAVEPKWYARWLAEGCFKADREFLKAAIFDRHSAAEHHWRSHARPCAE